MRKILIGMGGDILGVLLFLFVLGMGVFLFWAESGFSFYKTIHY